jgi:hypothetical protein
MQDRYRRIDEILLRRTAGPYIGSFTSILACPHHVRYSLHRDRIRDIPECPKRAKAVSVPLLKTKRRDFPSGTAKTHHLL